MPDPESTDNPEFKIVLGLIRDSLKKDPTKWTKYAKALQGAPPHLAGSQPQGPQRDCSYKLRISVAIIG